MRVYVSIREVPEPPCLAVRDPGVVHLVCDPRASKLDINMWVTDQASITIAEHQALRRAWGQPPVDQPMQRWIVEGRCLLYVPKHLRIAGAPAIQGGAVMEELWLAGELSTEIALLEAELRGHRETA